MDRVIARVGVQDAEPKGVLHKPPLEGFPEGMRRIWWVRGGISSSVLSSSCSRLAAGLI